MDCRRTVGAALVLTAGIWGCAHKNEMLPSNGVPPAAATNVPANLPQVQPPAAPVVTSKPDTSPRQPKAATCVAMAVFRLQVAEDEKCPPQTRETLRDEARRAYQQALKIDPDHTPAYVGLAALYAKLGDRKRALGTYQDGLKRKPEDADLWYHQGMTLAAYKEWDQAIPSLQKAVELEPEKRMFAKSLGFCLARAERFEESLIVFKAAMPEAEAHYNLARMLHHLNQPELGNQHLEFALQINPELKLALDFQEDLTRSAQAAGEGPDGQAAAFPADEPNGPLPPGNGSTVADTSARPNPPLPTAPTSARKVSVGFEEVD